MGSDLKDTERVYIHTEGGNCAFHNYLDEFAHVEDPLERRRLALKSIDDKSFGWYHIRFILIVGVGFLTDSYDVFTINLGIAMMSYVFWHGDMPSTISTILKVSTSVGTIIGQIGFGTLADVVGRKKVYGLELILMIIATALQCLIGSSPAVNFFIVLTIYRVVMGVGIGGDYPLSSIISSEFSTTKWRGAIMGAVFANQAWGQLIGGVISLILVVGYKSKLEPAVSGAECGFECQKACDQMWRILIGFGCLPGLVALYFRLTIPESPRYSLDVGDKVERVNGDLEEATSLEETDVRKASFKDFCAHFSKWRHFKILLGTAGSWFMLDVAFYGMGLNTADILQTIGYASSNNVYQRLYNTSAGNLILICAGSLPGYWASVATIDIVGRKPIQIMGFSVLTVLFCVIGFSYDSLGEKALLALYVTAQFFQNFGPNVTTFIVPGECFPTRYRSTAHGISAASGKIGAIVAQTAIGSLIDHNCSIEGKRKNCWLPNIMKIFSAFMFAGLLLSFLIPETKRKTLEQITEEYHGEIDQCKYVIAASPSIKTNKTEL